MIKLCEKSWYTIKVVHTQSRNRLISNGERTISQLWIWNIICDRFKIGKKSSWSKVGSNL